ncbi:ADP-ribosylglycohydrolase family protein [Oscillatoria sp. CS-180]|uniref:ADP-ribosylglycohydrolase family protein n=1 Tax=Oscillatoria sp. CS-180 TaxID=3021720 RepID=UPI00232DB78A|nr:ADP-ribosylglycohydrolase family protein [Oscillatoria sp. CS-180]MDB9526549.1 ADP-ribosylglycohydrolase family protein [Oscillatoria sp. CS-180]
MLGAIAGDMIGSVYEFNNRRTKDFPLFIKDTTFTDDTILSVAVADVLMNDGNYAQAFKDYYWRYPNPAGSYGARFHQWAASPSLKPYNSWGNGSAMRVSPVGFALNTLDSVLDEAAKTAVVTHNHPEGVKGAQATAAAIFWARTGNSKDTLRVRLTETFGYDLDRTVDEIRPDYAFNESCQGTVPEAIIAFLDSTDFEDAIRNAVSLGGDSDTLTCITGGIAHAFYEKVPEDIRQQVLVRLDDPLRQVTETFCDRYC